MNSTKVLVFVRLAKLPGQRMNAIPPAWYARLIASIETKLVERIINPGTSRVVDLSSPLPSHFDWGEFGAAQGALRRVYI